MSLSPFSPVQPSTTRVGWIGTGVMGHSMLAHVMDAGYACHVLTRTSSKADDLVQRGAFRCSSPAEVAAKSDIVFLMVGFPSDVQHVFEGADGLFSACRPGQIFVDMTTSQPSLAVQLAAEGHRRGVAVVDAPVSGGDVGARAGSLSIMIGGDSSAVAAIDSLFRLMGKTIVHQGGPGFGQHTKMVNQTLVAAGMVGVCEALLYATRARLDIEKVISSVSVGAAGSWAFTNLAPRIIQQDYNPGFFVEHFVKDMGIVLEESARMNLSLPGLALARQLYLAVMAQGHGRLGTQSLILALAKLNQMEQEFSVEEPISVGRSGS